MPAMNAGHDEPASATPGARFGKYRIIRRLGSGAFGTVYLALLPGPMGFAKRVALKTIRADIIDADPHFVNTMANEARIGGLLQHSNIVDTMEFGEIGGRYYLAMPYIEGPTLAEVIGLVRDQELALPGAACISLVVDVCRGLAHAHQLRDLDGRPLGIIHRDIKPSNLIVDAEGSARILDFGIAKAASNEGTATEEGLAKGTPRYMSPEQIRGEPLTLRSDLFSLGSVWFELITGRVLFDATGLIPMAHQILKGDLRRDLDMAEERLPGCRPLLARALQRDVERRFPDARAMAGALRELATDHPADVEMSQLIGELLNRVDRTHWRDVQGVSDLDLESDLAGSSFTDRRTMTPSRMDEPSSDDGRRKRASEDGTTRPFFGPAGRPVTDPLPRPPLRAAPTEEAVAAQPPVAPAPRRPTGWIVAGAVGLMGLMGLMVGAATLAWPYLNDGAENPDRGDEIATPGGEAPTPFVEPPTPELDPTPGAVPAPPDPGEKPQDHRTPAPDPTEVTPAEEPTTPDLEESTPALDEAAVAALPGTLTLRTRPWVRIYVDGQHLEDNFLLRRRAIDGGHHVVRLVCPQHDNREKVFEIDVDGGDVNLGCWDFETMADCR